MKQQIGSYQDFIQVPLKYPLTFSLRVSEYFCLRKLAYLFFVPLSIVFGIILIAWITGLSNGTSNVQELLFILENFLPFYMPGLTALILFHVTSQKISLCLHQDMCELNVEDQKHTLNRFRFRWSYNIQSNMNYDVLSGVAQIQGHTNSYHLNFECVSESGEKILFYQQLPPWANQPKNWLYFFERDHLKVTNYKIDKQYKIVGGLRKLKKHLS